MVEDKMKIALTNNIQQFNNKNVEIKGWAYNTRRSGKIGFLILRDGFGLIQCIIEKSHVGEDAFEEFKQITQETSLKVIGKVVKNDREENGHEVYVDSFKIFQISI